MTPIKYISRLTQQYTTIVFRILFYFYFCKNVTLKKVLLFLESCILFSLSSLLSCPVTHTHSFCVESLRPRKQQIMTGLSSVWGREKLRQQSKTRQKGRRGWGHSHCTNPPCGHHS